MFAVFGQISWLGIGVATIVSFLIGGVWFTAIFSKMYAYAMGREGQAPAPMAPILLAGPFVWGFVTSVTSAILIEALGIAAWGDALAFGLVAGIGYLAATTINTGLNPNIPRPMVYALVSGPYHVIAGVLICLIVFWL